MKKSGLSAIVVTVLIILVSIVAITIVWVGVLPLFSANYDISELNLSGELGNISANVNCTEDWSCSDWGNCIDDVRVRSCTDGNLCGTVVDRPALSEACVSAECGDGVIDTGESCDDGDVDDGDGCSASCSIESGYVCSGEPSVCSVVSGEIIYVDNSLGADCVGNYDVASRGCSGSDGDAYNTIQEGISASVAGDNVLIRMGTYVPASQISISGKVGTSDSAKITISNYGSEEVIVDGAGSPAGIGINFDSDSDYIVLDGLKIYNFGVNGIAMRYVNHVYINNSVIANSGAVGVYILESEYVSVTYSVVHDNGNIGIQLRASDYCFVDRNELYGNLIGVVASWRDTTQDPSSFNVISNNLAYSHHINAEASDGIALSTGTNYNNVTGNIVYDNDDDGIDAATAGSYAGLDGPFSNLYETITNNIAFNNGDGPGAGDGNGIKVSTNNGGGHTIGNNIVFDNDRGGFDQDKQAGYPQNHYYNNIAYSNGLSASNMHSGFVMDAHIPQDEDAILYNNIATDNFHYDLFSTYNGAINDSDYNFWGDGVFVVGMDANSLSGNAMFNNPGLVIDTNYGVGWTIDEKLEHIRSQVRDKFSLQAGSTAIDAGILVPGYHCVTAGATGDCVTWYGTAPDMGAYEYN
jgi:cysteine-rich repeat protein/parallel beta-helix repeat protein